MELNPYLLFNGNCREALDFYAGAVGGMVEAVMTHAESPMADQVPPGWGDKVLHARLVLGGQAILASDTPPDWFEAPRGFSISLNYDDIGEAKRVFEALADGGTVKMGFEPTFWAKGFGMLVDRFGIPWMVGAQTAG